MNKAEILKKTNLKLSKIPKLKIYKLKKFFIS